MAKLGPPFSERRALVIVLDSVGVGFAPDAADFGDEGANTLGHIRESVPDFSVPNLDRIGLRTAEVLSAGEQLPQQPTPPWYAGCMTEQSAGKDTTTGHWEISGASISKPFATFTEFPAALVSELEKACGTSFIGNYAQSGTTVLEELGEEHLKTGKPILYTSADSVLQIAAHEEVIPLERFYEICKRCRPIADRERIGRVIARPFLGQPGAFQRTSNRHDFSLKPPQTVLNRLHESGVETIGVGKISDIFAGSGIANSLPTSSNAEGCQTIEKLIHNTDCPAFIFANLVDFDMLYGHRRDPEGYSKALEEFDLWIPKLEAICDENLLVIITADHGNDPTWSGTDHTREQVPLLVRSPITIPQLGIRESFSDVAATLSSWFGVDSEFQSGSSFL